ncbi:MAG: hypothetical protein VSS75_028710 [Candidatus Parabeggiatoa sp.]|nr:hypothetical protein [Candidatus Parabeggiatoa sp.]
MNLSYNKANALFKEDKIRELASTTDGLKFLKLRSLSRKEYMAFLLDKKGLDVGNRKSRDWLELLYESRLSMVLIDSTISELYDTGRAERKTNEDSLISELYKVSAFEWGGLYQNSLEKTIVDNYVKKMASYDTLNSAIENELHHSMRAYVLASWYNHWTSIIIEDIFKDHSQVLPAVGLIKKIDFFVKDKPFDLKVTYLPEGYIKERRKNDGLRSELTLLKKAARELKIAFDRNGSESFLIPDLWQKLEDNPLNQAKNLIVDIKGKREEILQECLDYPERLVRWLYENQGVRRFDASNRLFLVLVDKSNLFESWKLKRAKQLIEEKVCAHLDSVSSEPGFSLNFNWDGKNYKTESDIIFVVKG